MKVYNVWAYDHYDCLGPYDLKGSFMNRDDAEALAALIKERGSCWDDPDFTPGDYSPMFDNVEVIEAEVK